jgi:predicted  nucleic acid-binding Zn-ribbon protein
LKREDLKKLGIDDGVIDQIMALHGQTVEKSKADLAALKTEADGLKNQLSEANSAIEGFKKLDIEGVRKQADEWKAKAEEAQRQAQEQISALKFDTALNGALASAKAKNPKAVQALIDRAALKYNEADGSIIGLKEQLEKVKSEADYLFESDKPAPRFSEGATPPKNLSTFTMAQIKAMKPDEINANWEAVQATLKSQPQS